MQKEIMQPTDREIREAASFDELFGVVKKMLREVKGKSPSGHLGYVAGVLTSDGPQHISRNIRALIACTGRTREEQDFPIFSSTDIFSSELVERLGHESAGYINFWRRVLRSGLVTDIFMTPRWQESEGATDEHNTAKEAGITVHFPPQKPLNQ